MILPLCKLRPRTARSPRSWRGCRTCPWWARSRWCVCASRTGPCVDPAGEKGCNDFHRWKRKIGFSSSCVLMCCKTAQSNCILIYKVGYNLLENNHHCQPEPWYFEHAAHALNHQNIAHQHLIRIITIMALLNFVTELSRKFTIIRCSPFDLLRNSIRKYL